MRLLTQTFTSLPGQVYLAIHKIPEVDKVSGATIRGETCGGFLRVEARVIGNYVA